MQKTFKTKGTCSRKIDIEVEDGIIKNIKFSGGCDGSLKGIAQLVKGMKVQDAIEKMEGITCGMKKSSCPDQLANALKEMQG